LDKEGRALAKTAMQQLGMSARAFHRTLKLVRTIADLAGNGRIETPHPSATLRAGLAEAIQYRPRRAE
jgi:magnesium chelatase family protein